MCIGDGSDWINPTEKLIEVEHKKKPWGNMSYKLIPLQPKLVDGNVRIFTIGYGGMKYFEELIMYNYFNIQLISAY